ncbi:MAG: hypothetical protein AB1441_03315 [Bacillota bacterium]
MLKTLKSFDFSVLPNLNKAKVLKQWSKYHLVIVDEVGFVRW